MFISRSVLAAVCVSLLMSCTPSGVIPSGPNPMPSSSPSIVPSPGPGVSPSGCTVASTFDSANDGWQVIGDAERQTGVPQYMATGGNPGGYLSAEDDVAGGTWYWAAPAQYLGEQNAAYQGTLSFQLKQSPTTQQFEEDDVIIEGAGKTLVMTLPQSPGENWTAYALQLNEDAGWKRNTRAGDAATAADLQAVLGNITRIWIRGEYVDGSDTGGLDNVRLQKNCGSTLPIRSTFDAHDDDWQVAGDAEEGRQTPQYLTTGGNPGGHIAANDDVTGGTWYWAAPEKFLGNQGAAYQKRLSFDLKQSNLNEQFDEADVMLVGAGQTLVLDLANNPGTDWTSYSVMLSESANWKRGSLEGEPATAADLRAVLGDLTQLWIRGEYVTGSDTGSLDNVIFGG